MTTTDRRETLIAFSNPVAGRLDEFREWYWQTHILEVLALPGFLSAQLMELVEEPNALAPDRFATVYEIEGSAAEARALLFSGVLGTSDLLDTSRTIVAPYSAPRVVLAP